MRGSTRVRHMGSQGAGRRPQVGYDQRSMSSRYESLVLDAIPPSCKRAVDVGCGNGDLTRELRGRGIPSVVGIDRDGSCIQRCKDHPEAGDISYLVGDLLTSGLEPASFDLVSAVASLHH